MTPFEKYFPIYQKACDNYERDHPDWKIEVLVSLIKWGLENLQYCIETQKRKTVTWDEPFIELHYPVEWNWNAKRDARGGRGRRGRLPRVTRGSLPEWRRD